MYLLLISLSALTLATTACAPTHSPVPSNRTTASAVRPTPSAPMAKRAPPQPGEQVSPVIAFRGAGADWNLQIENAGGYAHDVDLTLGNGGQRATGSLRYQEIAGATVNAPIALIGTLATKAGARTMRVEISAGACTDDADRAYTHRAIVSVEGLAPMHGCGDLAK